MAFISSVTDFVTNMFSRNNEKYFFAPKQSSLLGRSGATWIDTDTPYKIYQETPHVNLIINRRGAMFSNMTLKLVDKKGNEIEDPGFEKVIQNPNALQGMNDWLFNYLTQKDVYGNQYMYKSVASKLQEYPSSLVNISPAYINPVLTGNYLDQTEMSGVVKEYKLNKSFSNKETLKVDEVMWTRVQDINNPLTGISPLASMKYPISNTKLAYEYLNVISGEKGAIGILSNQTKDGFGGGMQLDPEEKEKLENAYRNQYGISEEKMKVIITNSALNWIPMTYPTKDLLLLEQIDAYFLTLIDHFKLNANIFSTKSATFENLRFGIIQSYQDSIIPEADAFAQNLTNFLKLKDGKKIIADYSHLQILKQESQFKPTDAQGIVDTLNQLIASNFISREEARNVVRNTFGTYIQGE